MGSVADLTALAAEDKELLEPPALGELFAPLSSYLCDTPRVVAFQSVRVPAAKLSQVRD